MTRVAAIVLAAGGSRRFGDSPKQLALLHGLPLLEHAVDAALAVPVIEEVVVVLGASADVIEATLDLAPARVVRCPVWEDGMSASLQAGVAALDPAVDCVLVLLGDQPRVTPQVVAMVVAGASDAQFDGVRAAYGGVPGHPVALRTPLLSQVSGLRGDAGARDLLRGPRVRLMEAGHLCDPTDVDTPHDLTRLEAIIR